jgi:hypothetical protein
VGGPHLTQKSDAHMNTPPLNPSQCAGTDSPNPKEPAELPSTVPGALGEELGQGKWVAAGANSSSEDKCERPSQDFSIYGGNLSRCILYGGWMGV